jgi:hypothetical protein
MTDKDVEKVKLIVTLRLKAAMQQFLGIPNTDISKANIQAVLVSQLTQFYAERLIDRVPGVRVVVNGNEAAVTFYDKETGETLTIDKIIY